MLTIPTRRLLLLSASSPFPFAFHRISHLHTNHSDYEVNQVVASFHKLLHTRPRPSVIEFNKLLSDLIKMKQFQTVISLSEQMEFMSYIGAVIGGSGGNSTQGNINRETSEGNHVNPSVNSTGNPEIGANTGGSVLPGANAGVFGPSGGTQSGPRVSDSFRPPENDNSGNTRFQSLDVTLNPSSPYYIHAGENPSLVLVTQPLTSRNYFSWSRSIKGSLLAKNKYCFVDGSLPLSAVPVQNQPAWHRNNQLVLSWIKHSISPQIALSIGYFDTAYQVWRNLKNRFSQSNVLHVAELQDEVLSTMQGDLSVTDYFTKLQIVWEELVNFRAIPFCNCTALSPENCLAIKQVRANQDQDFIIKFLRGLNANFGIVKSQILMLDPLPEVDRVFNLVLQHERQLEGPHYMLGPQSSGLDSNVHYAKVHKAESSQGHTGKKSYHKKGAICEFCNKEGHTIDQCFRKHGYPPNFKKRKHATHHVATDDSAEYVPHDITTQSTFSGANGIAPQQFNTSGITPQQFGTLMSIMQTLDPTAMASTSSVNSIATQSHTNVQTEVAPTLQAQFTPSGSFEQEDDWYS